jgi:hypothetical protein
VNSRRQPRRTFLFRQRAKKPVMRRDFRPFLSYTSALFHFPYPVTPLFATLTKTAGVYQQFPFWNPTLRHPSSLTTTNSPVPASCPYFSYSCALFCTYAKLNSILFTQFRTLSQKHRGWGTHPPSFIEKQDETVRHQCEPDRQLAAPYSSTSHQSRITSRFRAGCRPPVWMLRFGVP